MDSRVASKLVSKAATQAAATDLVLDSDGEADNDTTPETFTDYLAGIKNIVVDGPADRCIATVSAMQELAGFGLAVEKTERYAATQIGALMAAMLAMGAPLDTIKKELLRLSTCDFDDPLPPAGGACGCTGRGKKARQSALLASQYATSTGLLFTAHVRMVLAGCWQELWRRRKAKAKDAKAAGDSSKPPPKKKPAARRKQRPPKGGPPGGAGGAGGSAAAQAKAGSAAIQRPTGAKILDPSFRDVYEATGVDLVVIATDLSTLKPIYFGYDESLRESVETCTMQDWVGGDLALYKAVVASCAPPFAMPPQRISLPDETGPEAIAEAAAPAKVSKVMPAPSKGDSKSSASEAAMSKYAAPSDTTADHLCVDGTLSSPYPINTFDIPIRYKEEGVKTVKKYRAKFNLRPAGENFEPAERRQLQININPTLGFKIMTPTEAGLSAENPGSYHPLITNPIESMADMQSAVASMHRRSTGFLHIPTLDLMRTLPIMVESRRLKPEVGLQVLCPPTDGWEYRKLEMVGRLAAMSLAHRWMRIHPEDPALNSVGEKQTKLNKDLNSGDMQLPLVELERLYLLQRRYKEIVWPVGVDC